MQERLRELEAQKKALLEAEEAYQARAALDEDRLEQGMLNMEGSGVDPHGGAGDDGEDHPRKG